MPFQKYGFKFTPDPEAAIEPEGAEVGKDDSGSKVSILESCIFDPLIFPVKLLDPETSIDPVTVMSFCITVEPDNNTEPVITVLPSTVKELSKVVEEPETTNEPDIV